MTRFIARTRPIIQPDNCGCGSHVMAENQTKLSLFCQETQSAKKTTPVSKNLPVKTKLEFAGNVDKVLSDFVFWSGAKMAGSCPLVRNRAMTSQTVARATKIVVRKVSAPVGASACAGGTKRKPGRSVLNLKTPHLDL